jgi:hypothetical protein
VHSACGTMRGKRRSRFTQSAQETGCLTDSTHCTDDKTCMYAKSYSQCEP